LTPDERNPVRIVSGAPTVNLAPVWIALDKGYFRDAGIEVDYRFLGAGLADKALASGAAEAGAMGVSAATFNAVQRGVNNKIVSSLGCNNPAAGVAVGVMVRMDLLDSGQVRSAADLKGRTFAMNGGKTGGPAYNINNMLAEAGLTFADVNVVDLAYPDEVAAFTNKSIDAGWVSAPYLAELERQGLAAVFYAPKKPESPPSMLYSSQFMKERAPEAQALMVGLVSAARDLQGAAYKSEANLSIFSKYSKLPLDTVQAMVPYQFRPDLAPDEETIMAIQRFYVAEGLLTYEELLPIERLVDASFSKAAAEKLGPYRPQ